MKGFVYQKKNGQSQVKSAKLTLLQLTTEKTVEIHNMIQI